jgi:hypothetical protein
VEDGMPTYVMITLIFTLILFFAMFRMIYDMIKYDSPFYIYEQIKSIKRNSFKKPKDIYWLKLEASTSEIPMCPSCNVFSNSSIECRNCGQKLKS